MIVDGDFCTSCRRRAADHPGLTCPWCADAAAGAAAKLAGVDVDGEPAVVIPAADAVIDHLERRLQSARALRRAAARRAMSDPALFQACVAAGIRPKRIERFARVPPEDACSRGHPRAESGRWDGRRWHCTICENRPREEVQRPTTVKAPERKDRARLARAWETYEKRLEERQRLAELDQLPAKLAEPMPPPGPRPRRR